MGTRMAPSYANIYMSEFKENYLPFSLIQPILWTRFIDDILAIFICTVEMRNLVGLKNG